MAKDPFIVDKFSQLKELSEVQITGKEIGRGSYGVVLEVKIPGAVCVAKGFHNVLLETGTDTANELQEEQKKTITKFAKECETLSKLHHPHIVQFIGICFHTGYRLPLLVMEKLHADLHKVLVSVPDIPLYWKRSILLDVASGVTFLHSQKIPIVHRDLTARNILINTSMVAKIADLGGARFLERKQKELMIRMTTGPGNINYMPPEAAEDNAEYNESIDVFSFGHLTLFTLLQEFPENLKGANYTDKKSQKLIARSEIDRRSEYFDKLYAKVKLEPELQPIVQLMKDCLQNAPKKRPLIRNVLERIESTTIKSDRDWDNLNLELVRDLERLNHDLRDEIVAHKQVNEMQREGLLKYKKLIEELEEEKRTLQNRVVSLQENLDRSCSKARSYSLKKAPPKMHIQWKKLSCPPSCILPSHSPVVLEEKIYTCHRDYGIVVYDSKMDKWGKIKRPPSKMTDYTLVTVGKQLMAVGGISSETCRTSDKVLSWNNDEYRWECKYHPMPTPRHSVSATGYQQYLIVASGMNESTRVGSVEILDTESDKWYTAAPVPHVNTCSRLTLVHDILCSIGDKKMFKASVVALVRQAEKGCKGKWTGIWEHLPDTPIAGSKSVAIHNHLAIVGSSSLLSGLYVFDPVVESWKKVCELPEEGDFECTALSSEELILAYSHDLYSGKVNRL